MKKLFTEEEVIKTIVDELTLMLGLPAEAIHPEAPFETYRLNSIHAMQLLDELEAEFNIELSPLWIWEFPTIAQFAKQVVKELNR